MTENRRPQVRVAKVSLHPTTKILTYLNEVRIPLDETGQMVLRHAAPFFTFCMVREPGETFLFEWEGEFGEKVPEGIEVCGRKLLGSGDECLYVDYKERAVGYYHILIDTQVRKVALAHIVVNPDGETRTTPTTPSS